MKSGVFLLLFFKKKVYNVNTVARKLKSLRYISSIKTKFLHSENIQKEFREMN